MDIRQLRVDEFEDSLNLSEYAFQYRVSGEEREKAKQRFKPERVWGIYENGVLGAKLTLIPFHVYIQGEVQPMGGIAGVATWPENRRQGWVAELLSHTLQTMNEVGYTLSCLHPFLISFYRKFGWEVYCETKKYTIPVAKFPPKTEIEGTVKRDVHDLEVLDQLYSRFAAGYNGTLKRDRDWWEHAVLDDDGHQAVFYSRLGEPEGYVLYKLEKKELVIDEFVYMNEQARRGLWTFLGNHDSMVSGAVLKMVPADDILPYLLVDPRIPQEIHPYFMARIVNAKSFVERFTFKVQDSAVKRTIYIKDNYAAWNNGLWEWSVSAEGKSSLVQIDGDDTEAELVCDIGTLTVLLLGYKRPDELARCGNLSGDAAAVKWLEEIVPRAQTGLLDFF